SQTSEQSPLQGKGGAIGGGTISGSIALPPSSGATAVVPFVGEQSDLARLQEECRASDKSRKLAACIALMLALPTEDIQARYLAQLELGRAHRLQRQSDEAIRAFDDALRLRPGAADAYNLRGVARIDKRDFEGARADFTAAIEKD